MSRVFIKFFLVCIMLSSLLSSAYSAESKKLAFKGMELYSFLDQENNIRYALLFGTNRLKNIKEIIDSGTDLETLLKNIEKCAPGETVFWFNAISSKVDRNIRFVYPDKQVVKKIKSFCKAHQIKLELSPANHINK